MEYIKHTMTANDFFVDDIYSPGTLEKIVNEVKVGILQKLYFEKLKEKDNEDFIICFQKDYWSDYRINEEIDKYFGIINGLYRHPNPKESCYISRGELFDMIKSKNPFDIVLKLKTRSEFLYDDKIKKTIDYTAYQQFLKGK